MAAEPLSNLAPVETGRRVVIGGFIEFLSAHAVIRSLVCVVGVGLLVVGTLAAPFWNVPFLSWVSVGHIAGTSLTGGIGAIGLWWLSRSTRSRSADTADVG